MKEYASLIGYLGIKENEPVTINNEPRKIQLSSDPTAYSQSIFILRDPESKENIVRYACVDNIGNLLQLKPHFKRKAIQQKIERIITQDNLLMQKRAKSASADLLGNMDNTLIGEGKSYLLHGGKIRHSVGIEDVIPKGGSVHVCKPSARFITDNVLQFHPFDQNFSHDETNIFFQHTKIGSDVRKKSPQAPDIKNFHPIKDTEYGEDGKQLFHRRNFVEGADITRGYKVIEGATCKILIDSNENLFIHDEVLRVANPKDLKHEMDDFFSDGINLYNILHERVPVNLTRAFTLPEGATIQKIENTERDIISDPTVQKLITRRRKRKYEGVLYKVGDEFFIQDKPPGMGIKRISKELKDFY